MRRVSSASCSTCPCHVSRSATTAQYCPAVHSRTFLSFPYPYPYTAMDVSGPLPPDGCPHSSGFLYPRKVATEQQEKKISITDSQMKPLGLNDLTHSRGRKDMLWAEAESVADHCMKSSPAKQFQMSRCIDPCSLCLALH